MTNDEITAAWDARDRLLEELTRDHCMPKRTLYIRRNDGGTLAIGLLPDRGGLVAIDWKNAEYRIQVLRQTVLRLDPCVQMSEGFGGVFGFGEKGARGWSIRLLDGGNGAGGGGSAAEHNGDFGFASCGGHVSLRQTKTKDGAALAASPGGEGSLRAGSVRLGAVGAGERVEE